MEVDSFPLYSKSFECLFGNDLNVFSQLIQCTAHQSDIIGEVIVHLDEFKTQATLIRYIGIPFQLMKHFIGCFSVMAHTEFAEIFMSVHCLEVQQYVKVNLHNTQFLLGY